ncbi:hypothetical protein [Sphingobacterium suaedae]|uniref:DNA-binding protein n=1 Tax=Sphingobacterium suaedae TaxID=1686402 RepID=A0ABW5KFD9_9SPHI
MQFKTISIVEPELIALLNETAELGATKALVSIGAASRYITKQQAYKIVGSRRTVDRWIVAGALKVCHSKIDITELNAIAASANLATYVHTRKKNNEKADK